MKARLTIIFASYTLTILTQEPYCIITSLTFSLNIVDLVLAQQNDCIFHTNTPIPVSNQLFSNPHLLDVCNVTIVDLSCFYIF